MSEFDVVDLSEPTTIGFLSRDEEIRVAAITAAAHSQATGEYKPDGYRLTSIARELEAYIRNG